MENISWEEFRRLRYSLSSSNNFPKMAYPELNYAQKMKHKQRGVDAPFAHIESYIHN